MNSRVGDSGGSGSGGNKGEVGPGRGGAGGSRGRNCAMAPSNESVSATFAVEAPEKDISDIF